MNTLIYYSFNVLILSIVLLLVGMIKPKWLLFWVDKPTRLPVIMLSAVLFMVAAVMFGEGNKQLQQQKASAAAVAAPAAPASEVPVVTAPVPTPAASTPNP